MTGLLKTLTTIFIITMTLVTLTTSKPLVPTTNSNHYHQNQQKTTDLPRNSNSVDLQRSISRIIRKFFPRAIRAVGVINKPLCPSKTVTVCKGSICKEVIIKQICTSISKSYRLRIGRK